MEMNSEFSQGLTSVTLPSSLRPRKGKESKKELDEVHWPVSVEWHLPNLHGWAAADPWACHHILHSIISRLAVKADGHSDVPSLMSSKSDLAGNKKSNHNE